MERNMMFSSVPAPSVMAINKNFRFLANIVTNCFILTKNPFMDVSMFPMLTPILYDLLILQRRKNNA